MNDLSVGKIVQLPAHPKFEPEHISRGVQNAPHLDLPTKEGWYWCKYDGEWQVVRVVQPVDKFYVEMLGEESWSGLEGFADWHGPISPPVSANLHKIAS